MASTNTNTDNQNVLSTDIYEIAEFLDQVREDNIPDLDNTASIVGIFGYMNEMFSQTMQNALVVIAETTNETIPTRAKFTKNVINHAMYLGITDICATPAVMTMMIYLPISYIEANFTEINQTTGKAKFVLSRECPIKVGEHEFHLDYDIIFTRLKNPQGNYVYTGMYDLFETGTTTVKQSNPVSDIKNPYLTTIIQCTLDRTDFLAFSARLHQVTLTTVEKNILTSSSIENKAVTFEFDDQLAAFDVDVIENGETTNLTPIYSGLLDYTVQDGNWCYYNYINENTIRIVFSEDSYVPSMNAIVRINIQTSEGSNGNFTYDSKFKTSLKSDTYNNYNGMYAYIYPLLNGTSNYGKDKKFISDLRKIIPREASSRGAIINTTDLNNFFNSINDDECTLYFKKKKDNQFERMYYTYMLMKKNGYVYPTNTLDAKLNQSDFKGFSGNNNLVISPGTKFYYYNHGTLDSDNDFATITPPTYVEGLDAEEYPHPMTINGDGEMVRVFEYVTPFLISIDDDLITSYLLTCMNNNKTFAFDSINTDSDLQFVATNMLWKRNYIFSDNNGSHVYDYKYTMDITMTQNNSSSEYNLVYFHYGENGDMVFDDIRVRMIMVLYTDETQSNPYRYVEAELIEYSKTDHTYSFRFTMGTDDLMDLNNRINITGVYNCKPEAFQHKSNIPNSHGYMNKNTYAKIFIMSDFGTKAGDKLSDGTKVTEESAKIVLYGEDGIGNRTEIEDIIPTRDDLVESFLKNDIYLEKDGDQVNVVTIMKSNSSYMSKVKEYNGNEQETESAILKYLRNNIDSDFVQNILLKDEDVIAVIDSYSFEDFSRYTVCNVMSVDDGIDFYHDYSAMMRSTVNVKQIQKTDSSGNLVYKEINRTDSLGNNYIEYKPIYLVNDNGTYYYNYEVKRIPLLRANYLTTEALMQEFIFDLEERRKYIEECLYTLEDTFDIDLKFFNTYGPSRMFYYNIPSSQNYKVKVSVENLKVLSSTEDEDDEKNIVGWLHFSTQVNITKVRGQWGYITSPYTGWIKLADTTKVINYIDNVALTMQFALEAESSADKYIADDIVNDIKEYIEDINEINELHIPNIITLITNNYREQLVYFEFLDTNGYGAACQHLYLDEQISADICPEFLNIATTVDGTNKPNIEIAVY
jgi:hypothetical protein